MNIGIEKVTARIPSDAKDVKLQVEKTHDQGGIRIIVDFDLDPTDVDDFISASKKLLSTKVGGQRKKVVVCPMCQGKKFIKPMHTKLQSFRCPRCTGKQEGKV